MIRATCSGVAGCPLPQYMTARQRRLLSEVGAETGDHQVSPGFAEAPLAAKPVDMALPGAQGAIIEDGIELLAASVQLAAPPEGDIVRIFAHELIIPSQGAIVAADRTKKELDILP